MRIVVLDGRTTNPGDISWEPLAALGELTVYDTTPPELAAARAREADVVIYCRMNITAELIDALPRLRYLGTLSTGYNITDLQAAARRGIPVCNVPNTAPVPWPSSPFLCCWPCVTGWKVTLPG